MTLISYPLSKPISLALDKLFSAQGNKLHSRHELGVLITEHLGHIDSELDENEVEIVKGALQLSEKKVSTIMTNIKHVYWLDIDDKIDASKIDEIKLENWSRIPVFDKDKTECFGVVLMKDMVDVDFDENAVLVRDLPLYPTKIVGAKTALDTLFRKFIAAHSHLMPVERNDRIVGVVTIEDLIEEILGHEIEDESDV